MVCIYCGGATQVSNSRLQKNANHVWRRRSCTGCSGIFTTHEAADLSTALVVQYSDRDFRPFNQDMLFTSLYESCKHRSTAATDAGNLTQTVLSLLRPHIPEGAISRTQLVLITSEVLTRFDATAAAVYTAFHKT